MMVLLGVMAGWYVAGDGNGGCNSIAGVGVEIVKTLER